MIQKEIVARFLAARIGQWVPGYVIVGKASSIIGKDYLIQDADTRAYDLVEEGFESQNARYTFEHRKKGKYAEFRCSSKQPLASQQSQYPNRENLAHAQELCRRFDANEPIFV